MSDTLAVLDPLKLILDDVIREFPALCDPLMDDFNRLNLLVKTRGETVLTVDLPKIGKLYDRGFQSGTFDYSKVPHSLGSRRKDNVIFKTLLAQTYRANGELVYPEAELVFFTRCVYFAYKKLNRQSPISAKTLAVRDFLEVEKSLSEPTRKWNGICPNLLGYRHVSFRDFGLDNSSDLLLDTLDRVSGILGFNRSPDPRVFKFKHGPGAVADKRRVDDKYDHKTWPIRAYHAFPYSFTATMEDAYHYSEASEIRHVLEPAKLIAVPKTYDKPRLIASEPTACQFLQQGLLGWMRSNMHPILHRSIAFLSQEPSRSFCTRASLGDDFATVDLSSASDRMSCKVVERLFSSNESFLQLLYASRTSSIINGIDDTFEALQLKKFAAMGSAVTFPVQTLLYTFCAYAAILTDRNMSVNRRNLMVVADEVQVYGDDIIMPSSSVATLDMLLTLLELKVNVEKTFTAGPFRESCGMDSYQGYDVTPCYIRTDCPSVKGENLQSWIDVSNNAYRKGLWSLAAGMIELLPLNFQRKLYVHNTEQPFMSLLSFSTTLLHPWLGNQISIRRERLKENDYQRWVIPCIRETSQSEKSKRDHIHSLLQWFIEDPSPELLWESGYGMNVYKRKISRLWVHPQG